MAKFKLNKDFNPAGDQPEAISRLVEGLRTGYEQSRYRKGAVNKKRMNRAATVRERRERKRKWPQRTLNFTGRTKL